MPLPPVLFAFYLVAAAASGVLIGASGIGGVLLLPLLLLLDVPVAVALPAVLASYCPTSAVAVVANLRRRALPLRPAVVLGVGVGPGATTGALLVLLLPPVVVPCLTAVIACVSGALTLRSAVGAWLPFMLVKRTQLLYHFLPSLLFSLLLLGLLFDLFVPNTPLLRGRIVEPQSKAHLGLRLPLPEAADSPEGLRWLLLGLLVYALVIAFAFFAPLAYGFPLDLPGLEARMWLSSWN